MKPGLDLERSNTYVGDNSKVKKEQLDKWINHIQKRTGTDLSSMPVLANKRQIFKNLVRTYIPQTLKQVPSRIRNAASTVGALAVAPVAPEWAAPHLASLFGSAAAHSGNFYNGHNGTVNVTHPSTDTLAHEVGHWVDMETGKGPYPRNIFGMYKDKVFPHKTLQDEVNASLFARKALNKPSKDLHAALGTYLYGLHPRVARRSFLEWMHGGDKYKKDKNWKRNLPEAMASGDKKLIRQSFRGALNQVSDLKKPWNSNMFKEDGNGHIIPLTAEARKLTTMAKFILDSEQKRLNLMNNQEKKAFVTGFIKSAFDWDLATTTEPGTTAAAYSSILGGLGGALFGSMNAPKGQGAKAGLVGGLTGAGASGLLGYAAGEGFNSLDPTHYSVGAEIGLPAALGSLPGHFYGAKLYDNKLDVVKEKIKKKQRLSPDEARFFVDHIRMHEAMGVNRPTASSAPRG